jgi:ankyrin repeat protein
MGISASKGLLRAAASGDIGMIHKIVEHRGYIRVDVTNSEGSTSLILASGEGHSEIVSFLLKQNAYVNSANNKGLTALMCACYHGFSVIVGLLIEAGAELDSINKDGSTSLMVACWQGHFDVRLDGCAE